MKPGEYDIRDGEIQLNQDRTTVSITVANTGDRPIQVGSHYHFYETNSALEFDRPSARGFRLNIPAGTAIRFEPGQSRTVELVEVGGHRRIFGFKGEIMGDLKPKGTGTWQPLHEPPMPTCLAPPRATGSDSPTQNSGSKLKKTAPSTGTK